MVAPLWVNVLPENVGQSSPKFFSGCYPVRPPIMPNFIKIGQSSLEKSIKKCYLFGPSRRFFCHWQKRDYLSRISQRARGATKNGEKKCAVIKYLHTKGLSVQQIHLDMKEVLGDDASSQATVYRWTHLSCCHSHYTFECGFKLFSHSPYSQDLARQIAVCSDVQRTWTGF